MAAADSRATRIYRALLRLLPFDFRREFGDLQRRACGFAKAAAVRTRGAAGDAATAGAARGIIESTLLGGGDQRLPDAKPFPRRPGRVSQHEFHLARPKRTGTGGNR